MRKLFPGVFTDGKRIYTKSRLDSVYGEKKKGKFREWVAERSKLAAAIRKGLKTFPFRKDSHVLYLGAASGTTVSHLSDIVKGGIIYAVEFSERVARKLVELSEKVEQIIPVIADARKPEEYCFVHSVDSMFVDISQPDEIEIAMRNARMFLDGIVLIAVKSRSIDVTKSPSQVYAEAREKLKANGFRVMETRKLDPFEKDHAMIVAEFRRK